MITTQQQKQNRVTEEEVMEKLEPLINHPKHWLSSVSSSDSGDDEDDPMSYSPRPMDKLKRKVAIDFITWD